MSMLNEELQNKLEFHSELEIQFKVGSLNCHMFAADQLYA